MKLKRPLIAALLFASACLAPTGPLAAQTEPTPAPSATTPPPVETPAELIARDLVVLHADHFSESANDPEIVGSTLFAPIPHSDRRVYSPNDNLMGNRPMPLGFITFQGEFAQPTRVRLDLRYEGAAFHAHWPIYAQKGPYSVDWFDVHRADADQRTDGDDSGTHWLSPLRRAADRQWLAVSTGPAAERYLLYDASLPFQPRMSLAYENERFQIIDNQAGEAPTPPLTMLIQRNEATWSNDTQTAPWPEATVQIAHAPDQATYYSSPREVLAPLVQLLTDRGYNEQEIEVALGMVEMTAMQRSTVSLVYVMPDEQINNYISLRFSPQPTRVVRTAIVVVTNIDPNLGDQLDLLIAQLGADEWVVRDRAQWELINMGQAPIEKLQEMTESPDPEIAFRARQILDAYDMRTMGDR